MDKRNNNAVITEQQAKENGFTAFSDLMTEIAELPQDQQRGIAYFAQGIIAGNKLAAGTAEGLSNE